jgi:iron complex outermembrane recepter protein
VPDAQERYYAARRMSGSDWVGNPKLQPTRATGLHVDLETRGTPLAISLTAFYDRLDNYVTVYDQKRQQMVPGVMNTKARSYANVDGAMRGAELTASTPLSGRWFLAANAAWVRGTQVSRPELGIQSQDLAEIPPLTSRVSLRWDSGRLFFEGEGLFAAAQNKVNADVQESRTPGWGVGNLRGGFRFKSVSVSLAMNNVADRQYVQHLSYQRDPYRSGIRLPEPGRTFTANIAATF